MTETPHVVLNADQSEPVPAKKHFPTKLVISLAAATAAVVVGGWLLSKKDSEEETTFDLDAINATEDSEEETPNL